MSLNVIDGQPLEFQFHIITKKNYDSILSGEGNPKWNLEFQNCFGELNKTV